jgi:hypothetical protein
MEEHELPPLFKKGEVPHLNNIELGKKGGWRSNVWSYPGASAAQATDMSSYFRPREKSRRIAPFPQDFGVFRKDTSRLNHLQADSLRGVCFPPTRYLEIVAESR